MHHFHYNLCMDKSSPIRSDTLAGLILIHYTNMIITLHAQCCNQIVSIDDAYHVYNFI